MIALCIAEDLSQLYSPDLNQFTKLKPIFALLNELSRPFLAGKKMHPGKIAHVWIAAVDPDYRGLGLSTKIDMAVIGQASRKGYEFAYAEFTNDISEKVTSQFSVIKLLNRIEFDTFFYENGTPFKGVHGSAAAYVAGIRPGISLDRLPHCYSVSEKI